MALARIAHSTQWEVICSLQSPTFPSLHSSIPPSILWQCEVVEALFWRRVCNGNWCDGVDNASIWPHWRQSSLYYSHLPLCMCVCVCKQTNKKRTTTQWEREKRTHMKSDGNGKTNKCTRTYIYMSEKYALKCTNLHTLTSAFWVIKPAAVCHTLASLRTLIGKLGEVNGRK